MAFRLGTRRGETIGTGTTTAPPRYVEARRRAGA